MSDRNTMLVIPGHPPIPELARVIWSVPALAEASLSGEEAPRVGQATWTGDVADPSSKGVPYTVVALRLFEVGGLRLMDETPLPPLDDPEMALGACLSEKYGQAVYLFYEEELGAGGHARFVSGKLVERHCVDGRQLQEVVRTLDGDHPVTQLDPSEWVWPLAGAALEEGASAIFGPGIRNDDHLAGLLAAANAEPIPGPGQTSSSAAQTGSRRSQRPRKRDRVLGFLKKLKS
jgi:hypothetical protein